MKHLHVAFACLLLSSALLAQPPRTNPKDLKTWHITPGDKAGVITTQMTEATLIAVFGRNNVTWGDVDVGETQTSPGTILFASDPRRRLEILWTDNVHR